MAALVPTAVPVLSVTVTVASENAAPVAAMPERIVGVTTPPPSPTTPPLELDPPQP